MNRNTQQLATSCAESMPVGVFGLDDLMILGEIIYYGFEAWKACHHAANSTSSGRGLVDQAKATIHSNVIGDGQTYSNSMLRRAGKAPKRAARFKGFDLSHDDLNTLTTHMLVHVATAEDDVVVGCYAESPAAAMAKLESISDE